MPLVGWMQCLCQPFPGDQTYGIDKCCPRVASLVLENHPLKPVAVNQPLSIFLSLPFCDASGQERTKVVA